MEGVEGSTRCTACGTRLPPGFQFCGACGARPQPSGPTLETRRTVTVLFCDLVGSTGIGERLDPESVRIVVGRYFDTVSQIVEREGGLVEKFIGDAVMAVFGLPSVHEDDAVRAVRASLRVHQALQSMRDELTHTFGVALMARIGVNTGEVVSDTGASRQRMVTGDVVNTAARLEQSAAPEQVLIGPMTQALVKASFETRLVGELDLRGKSEPLRTYAVLGARARPMPRESSTTVGRENERRAIAAAWSDRDSRRPHAMLLVAPPGAGKSHLLRELHDHVGQEGAVTARTGCGIGIGAQQVLRQLAEQLDPMHAEVTTVSEVVEIVEHVGADHPALVLIEDLHWADGTILDLVAALGLASADLLVALSCRPETRERIEETLATFGSSTVVDLPPLDHAASAALAELVLGAPLQHELLDRVVGTTHGSPLFIEQTVVSMREEGTIARVDGEWIGTVPLASITATANVSAVIEARLDSLDAPAQRVLETASVVGESFASRDVDELLGEATDAGTYAELVARHLLVPTSADCFRFWHAVVRDTAYARMLKSRRVELHMARAGALSMRTHEAADRLDRDEEQAEHLASAAWLLLDLEPRNPRTTQATDAAARALADCGRTALARGETRRATAIIKRAFELPHLPSRSWSFLEIDLGHALGEVGEVESAITMLSGSLGAAEAAADVSLRWAATWALSEMPRTPDNPVGASDEDLERAALDVIDELHRRGDALGEAKVWRLAALVQCNDGRLREARDSTRRAAALATLAGDARQRQEIVALEPFLDLDGGTPVREAIRRCEETLDELEGNVRCWAFAAFALVDLLALDGQVDAAAAELELALAACRRAGIERWAVDNEVGSLEIDIAAGRLEIGLERVEAALHAHRDDRLQLRIGLEIHRASLLAALGRPDEGEQILAFLDTPPGELVRTSRLAAESIGAVVLAATGRAREGRARADRALSEIATSTDLHRMLADAHRWRSLVRALDGDDVGSRADRLLAHDLYVEKGDVARALATS